MTCAPSRVTSVTLPSRLHLKHLTEAWPGSMKLLAPQTGQFFSHGDDVLIDARLGLLALEGAGWWMSVGGVASGLTWADGPPPPMSAHAPIAHSASLSTADYRRMCQSGYIQGFRSVCSGKGHLGLFRSANSSERY